MVYVYSYHYNIEAALPIQKEKTTDSSQGDSKWLRVSFCALSTKLICNISVYQVAHAEPV